MTSSLRTLILEEKCPHCGHPKAYVGMNDVECPNKKCVSFSQRQHDEVTPAIVSIEVRNEGGVNADWEVTHADGSVRKFYSVNGEYPRREGDDGSDGDEALIEFLLGLLDQTQPASDMAILVVTATFDAAGKLLGKPTVERHVNPASNLASDGIDVAALEAALIAPGGYEGYDYYDGFCVCVGPGVFADVDSGDVEDRVSEVDIGPGSGPHDLLVAQVPVGAVLGWVDDTLSGDGIAHLLFDGKSFKV